MCKFLNVVEETCSNSHPLTWFGLSVVILTKDDSSDVFQIILRVFLRFYVPTTNMSVYIFKITTSEPFDLKLNID